MKVINYCNNISDAINEHFREKNEGLDSDVWCNEYFGEDMISLNWYTYLDAYVTEEYVTEVVEFIFNTFKEVQEILTPYKDFERKKLEACR